MPHQLEQRPASLGRRERPFVCLVPRAGGLQRIDEPLRAGEFVPREPWIRVVDDMEVEIQDHPAQPDGEMGTTVRNDILFPEWWAGRVVREQRDFSVMGKVDEFDGDQQHNPQNHRERNEIAQHACAPGQRADRRITNQIEGTERKFGIRFRAMRARVAVLERRNSVTDEMIERDHRDPVSPYELERACLAFRDSPTQWTATPDRETTTRSFRCRLVRSAIAP